MFEMKKQRLHLRDKKAESKRVDEFEGGERGKKGGEGKKKRKMELEEQKKIEKMGSFIHSPHSLPAQ